MSLELLRDLAHLCVCRYVIIGTLVMAMAMLVVALWVFAAREMRRTTDVIPLVHSSSSTCIVPATKIEMDHGFDLFLDKEANSQTNERLHESVDILKAAATNCGSEITSHNCTVKAKLAW